MESSFSSRALELDATNLMIAFGLVFTVGLLSFLFRLKLEKKLFWASLRTVIQLLFIGFILREIFAVKNLFLLSGVVLTMIFLAGHNAVQRSSRRFKGVQWGAFINLSLSALLTTFMVTQVVIGVKPWYQPQYLIPLLGMVLGNALTGISLCLDHLLEVFDEKRDLVELELSLGASRWEAALSPLRESIRKGMIPIINSMMVVGIVSLPGMMTGQILAGADPFEAVKYQIVVMFMIATATALGCIMMALFVYWVLFNEKHQLRAHMITKKS